MADEQNTAGTAAGSLGSIVGGVLGGTEQVKTFADNAKHFLDEAKAGHWAVDEETGTHIRSGIAHVQDVLTEIEPQMYRLQRAPMVGNDVYAQKVSQHMLASVDSDEQSLVPVVKMIKEGLDSLRDAVDKAISNYDASDEAATRNFLSFEG